LDSADGASQAGVLLNLIQQARGSNLIHERLNEMQAFLAFSECRTHAHGFC
jgi:hypothetical protein